MSSPTTSIKGFRIKLLPTEEQEKLLWKHVNASRFVWNYALATQKERYKNGEKHLGKLDLPKVIRGLKSTEEYAWLKEVSGHTATNVCFDLDEAYQRFFKKIGGKPNFKKKGKCRDAFPVRQDNLYFKNNTAVIEKIGKVKYQSNYSVPQGRNVCKFLNPRVAYENGKWVMGFGMECKNQARELNDFSVGIDLGTKELAAIAYEQNHKFYKNINKTRTIRNLERKKRHLQRKVSRKYVTNNGAKRYEKKWFKSKNVLRTEAQLREVESRIKHIRKNHIHQATHEIVELLPKRVVMEDLNIRGMMKNKHLSRAIGEIGWNEFIRQMKYKCEWNGIEFFQVGRFYPSSKTCSGCGSIDKHLKLSDRTYNCKDCGLVIDRDLNAARNLARYSSG